MYRYFAISLVMIAEILRAQPAFPQEDHLRTILADETAWGDRDTQNAIFYYEDRLRPSIRSRLREGATRNGAQELLAFIGDPSDLRLIVQVAATSKQGSIDNRWAYGVSAALLEPRSEQEWAFLRACALNRYDDGWVDAGAIQTLKLIASPRSLQILREVEQKNADRAASAGKAIDYIQSKPPALRGVELDEVAKRVANVIRIGKWDGNRKPYYNEAGDKALVDFVYEAGEDRLTYTATFHRVEGSWRLRGVRETLQELMPPPPPPSSFEKK
jgi:hypothetical protein